MAKLFSWDPWLELECMKEDMKRLVEDWTQPSPFARGVGRAAQFVPAADVLESEEGFRILVELPGLEREDVTLEVHGNELVVKGERTPLNDRGGVVFHVLERSYGIFQRRFVLPLNISNLSVHAAMRAGLLEIVVSKETLPSIPRNLTIAVEE